MANPFAILGVPHETATPESLKNAYKKLCFIFHPDKNKGLEEVARDGVFKVGEAYEEALHLLNGVTGARKTAFEGFTTEEPSQAQSPENKKRSHSLPKRAPRRDPTGQKNQEDVNDVVESVKLSLQVLNTKQKEVLEALFATNVFNSNDEIIKTFDKMGKNIVDLTYNFEENLFNVYHYDEELYDLSTAEISDETKMTVVKECQDIKDRLDLLQVAINYLRSNPDLPFRPDWIKTRSDFNDWYFWSGWESAVQIFLDLVYVYKTHDEDFSSSSLAEGEENTKEQVGEGEVEGEEYKIE